MYTFPDVLANQSISTSAAQKIDWDALKMTRLAVGATKRLHACQLGDV